jgi:hypothetical protein
MADTFTTNYTWTKPEPNASADTWGDKLNTDLDEIDADLKTVEDKADAAAVKTNNLSDLSNPATARSNLGLGSAAIATTGTSGANLGFLNGNNTTSGNNTHSGTETFNAVVTIGAGANNTPAATPSTTAVGYLGSPLNPQTGAYTLVMADAGKTVISSGNLDVTIPLNASVAFPIGTVIDIEGIVYTGPGSYSDTTVAPTGGVALEWGGSTGTRTLAS